MTSARTRCSVDYLAGVEMLRRPARRADRRARAGHPRQPPRDRRSPRCAAFAGSTRSRPPGCAPRSATGSAFAPSSCRGFSGSSRPSTPPTPSAARAQITKAGSSARPPAARRSRPPLPSPARRRREPRPPPTRPGPPRDRGRLARPAPPAPALDACCAGQRRKPAGVVAIACARELAAFCWEAATLTLNTRPDTSPRGRCCRGARETHRASARRDEQSASRLWATTDPPGRWRRPLLDRGPRRTQGHEVTSPRISAWRSPPNS